MAPIYMLVRTSIHSLVNKEFKSVFLNRIRSINPVKNLEQGQSTETDKRALESTIAFSYDLLREINKLNKRLSEAKEVGLKTAIRNEVLELISLVEVVNEILVLYKTKNKESIDPLKKKLSLVLQNPYETVEV